MNTYTRKRIDVTISLGTGQFGADGANVVTLTGLRVVADIANPGGESMGMLNCRIYGLPLAMVNQLTTVGPIATAIRDKNTITLGAGDDNDMTTIYIGTIDQAWGDYQGQPDVALNIVGFSGLTAAVKPIGANSYRGATDVATIAETLATEMGLTFENNAVLVQLASPYLPGAALAQLQALCRAAGVRYVIDRGVLAIWPKNGARATAVPTISAATGMVGYPAFTSNGLLVRSLFRNDVHLGGQVKVESTLPVACGTWNVSNVSHALESERPGGNWFTSLECYPNVG